MLFNRFSEYIYFFAVMLAHLKCLIICLLDLTCLLINLDISLDLIIIAIDNIVSFFYP